MHGMACTTCVPWRNFPSRRKTFSKGATCDTTHSGHMEWSVERPVHRIHLNEVRPQCWWNNRNHAKVKSIEDMGAKPPYLLQEGFNSTISKKVETMAASCDFVKIGDSQLHCS